MTRNGNGMTDEDRATVATIEAALAEGRATATDPAERELQELSLELRELAPEPDPDFLRELDARAAAGFPRPPRRRPRMPRLPRPNLGALRRPLLAGAAGIVIVGAASTAVLIGEGEMSSEPARDLAETTDESLESESRESVAPDAIEPVPPPTSGGGIAPGERTRRVERTARLTLAAPRDDLDRVADKVVGVTERRGGFVLSSSLETGDEGTDGGEFDLRVPATELRATLRELSKLGTVRAQSQTGQDRTQAFVSAEDKLSAAKAERKSLLKRLENADTDQAAEAIRDRLDIVGTQITSLRDQLRDLRERTNYAAIAVTLEPKDGSSSTDGGETGDALDDAVGSLEDALGIAIRMIGVAIPLALLAAAAWFGGRWFRRRRRESALD